ncbi:unknown [Alistipes sp. CAG:157]|nr:unknown [Alistipes sp. CAG:157]
MTPAVPFEFDRPVAAVTNRTGHDTFRPPAAVIDELFPFHHMAAAQILRTGDISPFIETVRTARLHIVYPRPFRYRSAARFGFIGRYIK